MEALLTLFALPVVVFSSAVGGSCTFQGEMIAIVEQDTSMTRKEKDIFIQRVKTKYPECFVENS